MRKNENDSVRTDVIENIKYGWVKPHSNEIINDCFLLIKYSKDLYRKITPVNKNNAFRNLGKIKGRLKYWKGTSIIGYPGPFHKNPDFMSGLA